MELGSYLFLQEQIKDIIIIIIPGKKTTGVAMAVPSFLEGSCLTPWGGRRPRVDVFGISYEGSRLVCPLHILYHFLALSAVPRTSVSLKRVRPSRLTLRFVECSAALVHPTGLSVV